MDLSAGVSVKKIKRKFLQWGWLGSVLLYGSECWCLRKEDERKVLTVEMTWLRKILLVTKRDKIKNIDIRETLQQKETIVDKIRKTRLIWFGHVSRMDERRLPSRAMYCYIKERRKRGWPPKKWIDNIKEDVKLTELSIGEAVNRTIETERNGVVSWQPHRQSTADGREIESIIYCHSFIQFGFAKRNETAM